MKEKIINKRQKGVNLLRLILQIQGLNHEIRIF